jgi:hypothetical protein
MSYQVVSATGEPLDAHLDVNGGDILFYSRSGASGTSTARNVDYSSGLKAVLAQLRAAGVAIIEVYVDSGAVQTLPISDRRILDVEDAQATPEEQFQRLSQRMRKVGRSSSGPGGNNNKLIRIRTGVSSDELKAALSLKWSGLNLRSANRIPDGEFRSVMAHHVWEAVEELRSLSTWEPYGPSKDYDILLEDGVRLPPKAVFGRAASKALGINVPPIRFSGGVGTPCFEIIRAAGFAIVDKAGAAPESNLPASEEESWAEGSPRLTKHIRRERARGLSQAKKSSFMAANDGRLFCEECGFEPAKVHDDSLANACIEVHHRSVMVALMDTSHRTKLADLQCLCANCHRLVHARLREAEKAS